MSAKTKLQHSLRQVLKKDRTGSFASRYDRHRLLLNFTTDLIRIGYKITYIHNLKQKHIQAVVEHWQGKNLSNATLKNRMSAIRQLAELINKPDLVKSNTELNIGKRKYVSDINRALHNPDFSRITNTHIKISLELQRVFGLRREESLKIKPHIADNGDQLKLSSSWCKGGRSRTIPIRTEEQRYWLEKAKEIAGKYGNSMIPEGKTYIKQRRVYDKQVERGGLHNLHGLRHAYAQNRYKELTGWEAPINGGLSSKQLTPEQKEADYRARMILTAELGHSREQITVNYCGR
jgi:site-specific recombinase XerD